MELLDVRSNTFSIVFVSAVCKKFAEISYFDFD